MRMMKKFGLLSLILCLVVVATNAEILLNPDMDGCTGISQASLTSWIGGVLSYPIATSSGSFNNEAVGDTCFASFFPFSVADSTITQDINILTTGIYDFSSMIACLIFGAGGTTCSMTLSINGQNIPLSGATDIQAAFPADFVTASASGISLTAGSHTLVLKFLHPNGDARLALTSSSLVPSASGSGDPHMIGFQGQRFDYIGEPGQVINLVSDPSLQVNALLNLQKNGENSLLPGPVMMEMAFMTRGHTVIVNAGGYEKDQTGFVTVDGVLLPLGHSFLDDLLSVVFTPLNANSHDLGLTGNDHIVAQVDVKIDDLFEFRVFLIENGKDNLHHAKWLTQYPRRFLDFNASLLDQDRRPHGVLGQTAAPLGKDRSVGEWTIEGKDQDYVVKDGLTGTQFSFNQF